MSYFFVYYDLFDLVVCTPAILWFFTLYDDVCALLVWLIQCLKVNGKGIFRRMDIIFLSIVFRNRKFKQFAYTLFLSLLLSLSLSHHVLYLYIFIHRINFNSRFVIITSLWSHAKINRTTHTNAKVIIEYFSECETQYLLRFKSLWLRSDTLDSGFEYVLISLKLKYNRFVSVKDEHFSLVTFLNWSTR